MLNTINEFTKKKETLSVEIRVYQIIFKSQYRHWLNMVIIVIKLSVENALWDVYS